MLDLLHGLTLRDWITVFLTPLALMGGINAFLGLRERFRRHSESRNKDSFVKALHEYSKDIATANKYRDYPIQFLGHALIHFSMIFLYLFLALMVGIGLLTAPTYSLMQLVGFLLFNITGFVGIYQVILLWNLAMDVAFPGSVKTRLTGLLTKARSKGYYQTDAELNDLAGTDTISRFLADSVDNHLFTPESPRKYRK